MIGLEESVAKAKIAQHFVPVIQGNDSSFLGTFDTILIGNALEEVDNPYIFLQELKKWLKKDGTVVGEAYNIATKSNISSLLKGEWYQEHFRKQNHFTRSDLEKIFSTCGYEEDVFYPFEEDSSETVPVFLKQEENDFLSQVYYSFRFRVKDKA